MKKTFDIGIYQFKQILRGPMCQDEHKLRNHASLAVLHPVVTDSDNLYCFAIDYTDSKDVVTLLRKNLQFRKIITITYDHEANMDHVKETHAKYNAALAYLVKEVKQLEIAA